MSKHMTTPSARELTGRFNAHGFSLIELMVAMALGLLLTIAMGSVYFSSRTAFSRQQQLGSIQQSVRIAFSYLRDDARMVGHMGCFTGLPMTAAAGFNSVLPTTLASNYAVGVEGYEYTNATPGAYTLGSNAPADVTAAGNWTTNTAGGTSNTIAVATIAGTGNGLTPGSDVLVIRTVSGRPVRLAANANVAANQTAFTIETIAGSSDKCSDGTTAKVSGFCASSHGLIASCTQARVFQVSAITAGVAPAASTLTLASMATDPQYVTAGTEVFPMQTIVYYVKKSSSGTTTSLYRRIFDGDRKDASGTAAQGQEQELIEGVENLQVKYGVELAATPNGIVANYVTANAVTDWSLVVAVRMGLVIRSTIPVEADVSVAAAASSVNGVAVTYPTTGSKYDRRVFTTTVAVRNRIAYF